MKKQEYNLYTIQEVADILRVSYRTIFRYVKDGRLKAVKIGNQWRIKKEDLDKLINK